MTTFTEAYQQYDRSNEQRADHHVAAAARALDASNKDLWVAAFHSWRMWRTYQDYGTKNIADAVGRDRSQIENYAHAYDMFVILLQFGTVSDLKRYRRKLTASHFWRLWGVVMAHDNINRRKLIKLLENAVLHSWSAGTMVEELLTEIGAKRPPIKVATVRRNFANAASEILSRASDFTVQAERDAARLVLNLFGDALKDEG